MVIWKQLRYISLGVPEELLADVDEAAKVRYMSRSDYIRFVLHKATTARPSKPDGKRINADGKIDNWFLDADDS